MRFIVLGAGAIGGVIGGQLAKAGFDVLLMSTNIAHVDAINRHGLILKGIHGTHRLPIPAVKQASDVEIREEDVVILAVKCFACEAVVRELRNATRRDIPIFCAQNGVRNEEIAAKAFGDVNGILVEIGATRLSPGEAVHTVSGFLGIGTFPAGISQAAQRVIGALEQTDLTIHPTDPIMPVKWNKLLENLNNATAGLTGLSGQALRANSEIRRWMADVIEEGARVLTAARISYEPLPGMAVIESRIRELRNVNSMPAFVQPTSFEHRSSLWQDLHHRRGAVEADFLNGEVVRLGRAVGLPTPYNSLLLQLANDTASKREGVGSYAARDLREALYELPDDANATGQAGKDSK